MLKICLIGSKPRVLTFANQLVLNDIEVHIISNRIINDGSLGYVNPNIIFHNDLIGRLKNDNNKFWYLLTIPRTIYRMRKLIQKNNLDIIHVFFIGIHAWICALININPIVLTTMGSDININQGSRDKFFKNWFLDYTIKKAKLITVQTKQGFKEIKKVDKTKMPIFFRAGYDPRIFHPSKKDESLIKKYSLDNKFIILSPRGFNKDYYNIETIVKGFTKFNNKEEKSILLLLGNYDNNYGKRIKSLVKKYNMESHVIFLGHINRNDVADYFLLSDVAVSLVLKDGFPASLIEIMACGKPVIAGQNQSINELMKNEVNGYIIDNYDYEMLCQKLLELHNNKKKYTYFANNNIEDSKKHTSIIYCKRILNYYKQFLDKQSYL